MASEIKVLQFSEGVEVLKPIDYSSTRDVKVVTADYNVLGGDRVILVDSTIGVININLPDISTDFDAFKGIVFTVKKISSDSNYINVASLGALTIDGFNIFSFNEVNASYSIICTGEGFNVI